MISFPTLPTAPAYSNITPIDLTGDPHGIDFFTKDQKELMLAQSDRYGSVIIASTQVQTIFYQMPVRARVYSSNDVLMARDPVSIFYKVPSTLLNKPF